MAAATSEKYEKLAAEYAKLKAQVGSLKKAYLDEHTECAQIKDQVKEKDQWMRKCEQEVDSLSFRNQQLSRRVEVLQGDLDTVETQRRKHKHKGGDGSGITRFQRSTSVFDEELQGKMEENTRLQAQLQEVARVYEQQILDLEERVKRSDQDQRQHAEVVSSLQHSSSARIEALQQEKAVVEEKMWAQENEIRDYRSRAEVAEDRLVSVQTSLQTCLSRAASIIAHHLPFIDTKHQALNTLNLPTYDRKHQARARDLIGQAATIVGEMTQGLCKFFTYSEQRSRIFPADGQSLPLSPVNLKYCQFLHDNMSYLRPVEQTLALFSEDLQEESLIMLETASDLQDFARSFSQLVAYCNKLLPYQVLSLDEESQAPGCPALLGDKNRGLQASLRRFNTVLNKISTYLTLLSMQSRPAHSHPSSSHGRMFRLLSRTMEQLHEVARETSKVYNAKVSLEHQLPTATPKLKMIDECVVSSLVSVVTSTAKMSAFLLDSLDFLTARAGAAQGEGSDGSPGPQGCGGGGPGCHPQVTLFQHRTATFLSALNARARRPDSVPHQAALTTQRVLHRSVESREGLGRQVALLQHRAGRLQQDKERLVLEMQLLKVKYDAERQKAKAVERELEILHSCSGSSVSVSDTVSSVRNSGSGSGSGSSSVLSSISTDRRTDSMTSTGAVETSILGQVQVEVEVDGEGGGGGGDVEKREEIMKDHFSGRLNALTLQIQRSDSMAVAAQAEVRALHKQLKQVEVVRSQAQEELTAAAQSIMQLQDELHTTSQSYEDQLSVMSDHLSGMNETLARQKDEIDYLRAQQEQSKGAFSKMSKKFRR